MLGDIHAAVIRNRNAWPALVDATMPGPTRRAAYWATDAQLAEAGRLYAAELADWIEAFRRGDKPMGVSPAPLLLGVVDAKTTIERTLAAVADTLHRAIHGNGLAVPGDQTTKVLGYLAEIWTCAPNAHPDLYPDTLRQLRATEWIASILSGWSASPRRLPGDPVCPCCGDHALRYLMETLDERMWTVSCTSKRCRCRGVDCDCGCSGRVAGTRHVWTVGEWQRLAAQIDAMAGTHVV